MKVLTYIAVGTGIFFTGRYLLSLSRISDKAIISVRGRRGLISAQGINVKLNYNIKNPSRANLRISPPLIKLSVNGKTVASSTMQSVEIPKSVKDSNGRIVIKKFSETGEITTTVLVPWINLLAVSPQILTRLQSGDVSKKVTLTVETLSHAFTAIGDFPMDSTKNIEL